MKMSPAEKSKALFILNPNAGVQPVNFIISKDLERRRGELKCLKTLDVDHTKDLIRQHREDHQVIVAAGGDGTVHSVATQLVGSENILGVLPLGSGNGFAREFGFRMNVRSLLSSIGRCESMKIDMIEINGNMCLNVAGIGLDSFVAHSFNELKLRGFLPYVWLTFKTFVQLRPFHVILISDGQKIFSGDLFVLTFANTRQFGNNAFIAPEARPNDGRMNIVLVKPFPKILGPVFMVRLFTKKINNSKYVQTISTEKEVIIETDEKRFHVDGEPLEISERVVVKLRKDVLNVLKTPHNKFSGQQ
ncbi:MAG TPA: YegS/Rv2252/BmrU family lipid kinase [Bacteroidales bacterium]|jgi:YegS/Rv2252/BmrU family lipid kinase|nr:YegS/Rv2252/BmrU family lipid kinase [Bacteroidales bacterium]